METLQRTANRGSVPTGYNIDNSLKLEADNTEYLTRTPSSAGNEKTWTWSGWIKYTSPTVTPQTIFAGGTDSGSYGAINFRIDAGKMELNTASVGLRSPTQRFRDPAAWYHIIVAMDTTQSTADDRIKIYVNGSQITDFETSNNPPQDTDTGINANELQTIGRRSHADDRYFSGYIAEVHLIDGTALTPTSFGEYDDDSGIWIPKAYDGSYGTNGYYLDFEDSSSLGTDQSGNGNNFTLNNITSADQATDTPTNNFCTLNPDYQALNTTSNYHTVSNGGTFVKGNQSSTVWTAAAGTIPLFKGKWYWEIKKNGAAANTNMLVGVGGIDENQYNWRNLTSITDGAKLMFSYTGFIYGGGSGGFSFDDGDIVSIALDQDNGGFYLRKNGGTWTNSGDPASGSNLTGAQTTPWGTSIPAFNVANNVGGLALNFGGFDGFTVSSGNTDANGYGNFEYAPPSGYYAICSKNLAEYG